MDLLEVKQELLKLEDGNESVLPSIVQNNARPTMPRKLTNLRRKLMAAIGDANWLGFAVTQNNNVAFLTALHGVLVFGLREMIALVRRLEQQIHYHGGWVQQFDPTQH